MKVISRLGNTLLRAHSAAVTSVRFPSDATAKTWKDYKGEDYDPDAKVLPGIKHWKQEFNPEVDTANKTTVSMINEESKEILMVNGYSPVGFSLNNGMRVLGPMILFSKSIFRWKVNSVEELTPEAFSLFYLLDPKIDILVIGYGDKGKKFDHRLLLNLTSRRRLGVEVLPTEQAVATFNWLNSEKRYVGGAFIPPPTVVYTEDELHRRAQMLGLNPDDGEAKFTNPKYKLIAEAKARAMVKKEKES